MSITRREFVTSMTAIGASSSTLVGSVTARSERGQQDRLVVDGLDASTVKDGFLGLMREGGAHCVHTTRFRSDSYAALYGFVDAHSEEAVIATTVRDIRQAHRDGKISFVLGAQAAGGMYGDGLEEAMAAAPLGSLGLLAPALQALKGLGLRIQGVCYNTYNVFGSGCLNHSVPLTRAGRRLVEEIHQHQIVLDVGGHTGERTSLDAIEMSTGVPIVCTHTNFAALNANMRCISDRLAEAIARTGGVIGLTAISDFIVRNPESAKRHGPISPVAPLDALLDQYDHAKRLVGVDHVALGPDFVWGQGKLSIEPDKTVTFPSHTLSATWIRTVEGYEDISMLPNLIGGLRGRGWTEPELDKVLGENWLRVYERVWGD